MIEYCPKKEETSLGGGSVGKIGGSDSIDRIGVSGAVVGSNRKVGGESL